VKELERSIYDEAYRKGHKEGLENAQLEISELKKRFDQAIMKLIDLKEIEKQRLEKDLVSLVMVVAKKIIAKEISLDHEIVAKMAIKAIEKYYIWFS